MPAKKKSASKKSPPLPETFEEALHELEHLTEQIEEETMPLGQLIKAFQRGQDLLKFCQNSLTSARESIELIETQKLDTPPAKNKTQPDSDSSINDDDVRLF